MKSGVTYLSAMCNGIVLSLLILWPLGGILSTALGEEETLEGWHGHILGQLRFLSMTVHSEADAIPSVLDCQAESKRSEIVSAEHVWLPILRQRNLELFLLNALYLKKAKPINPSEKDKIKQYGSSYNSWCMGKDKWELARHFVTTEHKDGGVEYRRFPVIWTKRPDFYDGNVYVVDILGNVDVYSNVRFERHLDAARQWVDPSYASPEDLLRILQEGKIDEKVWALRLLGTRKDIHDLSILYRFLDHDDLEVCSAAIWAVGFLGRPEGITFLAGRSGDKFDCIRIEVANALGRIGGHEIISLLSIMSDDPDRGVRLAAIGALRKSNSKKAVPVLFALLGSKDMEVRQAALEALVKLGWSPADMSESQLPLDPGQDLKE